MSRVDLAATSAAKSPATAEATSPGAQQRDCRHSTVARRVQAETGGDRRKPEDEDGEQRHRYARRRLLDEQPANLGSVIDELQRAGLQSPLRILGRLERSDRRAQPAVG